MEVHLLTNHVALLKMAPRSAGLQRHCRPCIARCPSLLRTAAVAQPSSSRGIQQAASAMAGNNGSSNGNGHRKQFGNNRWPDAWACLIKLTDKLLDGIFPVDFFRGFRWWQPPLPPPLASCSLELNFEPQETHLAPCDCLTGGDARIKVIGVGGGGGNAVNRMIASGLQVRVPALGSFGHPEGVLPAVLSVLLHLLKRQFRRLQGFFSVARRCRSKKLSLNLIYIL